MYIEHIALNVPDPVAMAEWYTRHLGLRVVRRVIESPFTHFLVDSAGRTVVEIYKQSAAPVPDYFAMNPLVLHIAFSVTDVHQTCATLLAAGAHPTGEIVKTPTGDDLGMLRDPWGVPIQFVRRNTPLLG